MTLGRSILLTAIAASTLFAQNTNEQYIKIGQEASQKLLKTLGSNLQKHMKSGGVLDAAEFCSTNALALTQKVNDSLKKNVTIKRISLRPRNPINTPSSDEKIILEKLHKMQDSGIKLPPYFLESSKNEVKFYKPLLINKPVCLKCHGDIQGSKIGEWMNKHYPQDKATGYKMNDLRGAVVVKIEK